MDAQERGASTPDSSQPSTGFETVGTLTRLSDGRSFSLGFGSLRIGRQRRADLAIADRTVSRHHADICYESGRYVLYDHSSNGTRVNDNLVVIAQSLRDGDAVKFGRAEFRFSLKSVPKHAAARTEQAVPTRIPGWPTRIMKGGRGRRKERRGGLLSWFVAFVLLVAVAAVVMYFFFPDLAGRVLP